MVWILDLWFLFSFFLPFIVIYLFLAVLVLCCCVVLSPAMVSRGCSLVVVHGLLMAVVSLAVRHGL